MIGSLGYYDPRRQNINAEHVHCVMEDGVRWFGHGMECRRPDLHAVNHSTDQITTEHTNSAEEQR